jgi:hypothetical protein
MIPVGSLTAVQEIVNGSVTLSPSAGETADGGGGAAATARLSAATQIIKTNNRMRYWRPNVLNFMMFSHDRKLPRS